MKRYRVTFVVPESGRLYYVVIDDLTGRVCEVTHDNQDAMQVAKSLEERSGYEAVAA